LEQADSVAVSAHKWLFQPKESALVFFREASRANAAISFQGGYLAVPNVGVLGSHGAMAVPLLGTFMAWGRQGMAERVERCMLNAERLAHGIKTSTEFELFGPPETGVVVFRSKTELTEVVGSVLGPSTASSVRIKEQNWVRCVAANPLDDVDRILNKIGLT
jgi:L-2,4-diaminobutyrate decarboxylase